LRKTLPSVGVCVTLTTLFCAYAVEQVPIPAELFRVQFTPPGDVVIVPPPAEPLAAEMDSVGGAVNCAVTVRVVPVAIGNTQVAPVHAPEYVVKVERPDGVAVSVTVEFCGNDAAHVPLRVPAVMVQLIPDGLLVTTPLPEPAAVTETPCV
jgi:hypothetical protein